MRIEKTIRKNISILLAILLVSVTCVSVSAASTDVYFTIEKSTVANLYYEIIEDGGPITEDMIFEIVDPETGEIIARVPSENGVILIPNVPFGDYIIRPADGSGREYHVSVDTEYLLTAHEKKTLDLSEENSGLPAPSTGDQGSLLPAAGTLLLAAAGLMILRMRRKEDEQDEA